ncbi:hypothetical protein BDW02DRAFT_509203 [Decorospora gaudefroyi]|uniref:Uncharacterized protein n=1 Tax=Decorospora gaudefroyi TaxID=184978 RepID=A0A6A5JXY3_9PLEO|nr:hypothetical protein BDW02DRAFT_509203 [Decorospora gaudefroyi]
MVLEAPPPRRHISSAAVSVAAASTIVDRYLKNAETQAHLHPDASITPRGITFNAQRGATGSTLMHQLQRVAAGLRGEYLEPDNTLAEQTGQDAGVTTVKSAMSRKQSVAEDAEWQDMASYQAEQGIEIGELADRTNVVHEGGEEPAVEPTTPVGRKHRKRKPEEAPEEGALADGELDKAARKQAKKERAQREKREKERKHQQKAKKPA